MSVVLFSALTAVAILCGPSAAGQPSDSLDDQIAAAEAELKDAQAKLAQKYQAFTSAEQRHQRTDAAAKAAQTKATKARAEAERAARQARQLRLKFDEFTSASFRQGSTVGSVSAYLGSDSPTEMLDRASLLNVLSGEHVDVLDQMRQAVDRRAATERQARAALQTAVKNRDAAAKAKADAKRAYETAVAAEDKAKAETAKLAQRRAALTSSAGPASSGATVAPGSGSVVKPTEGTLTSTYGPRGGTIHYGIDIANSIGTPIWSAMAGEVIDVGTASGFGYWVRVQHDNGLITVYGHISSWSVNVGQRVGAGEEIAKMGNEGQSTGPHLHFEVHQNGNKIDPLPWLRSHGVNI